MSADAPVRIGVQLAPQQAPYAVIRDTVLRLEDLGVDIAFNWDHFFPLSGDRDGLHFEGWSMLAAWAEQTERIEFGCLVGCNSYRNADLQADMARTIDHISAKDGTGRFVFGTGSGWFRRDYVEYGSSPGSMNERASGRRCGSSPSTTSSRCASGWPGGTPGTGRRGRDTRFALLDQRGGFAPSRSGKVSWPARS